MRRMYQEEERTSVKEPRIPVYPLFSTGENGHLYEPTKFSNCHCVIDGSCTSVYLWRGHRSWEARDFLSDEARFAAMVENFFLSFRRANITPHVLFRAVPATEVAGIVSLVAQRRSHVYDRIQNLDTDKWESLIASHCRIIFGEVLKRLRIHNFLVNTGSRGIAAYAMTIDAFVISRDNFFYLAKLPRGYLELDQIPLENLAHESIDICGRTYFREKFLNSFKYVEPDKTKALALFVTIIEAYNRELLIDFFKSGVLHSIPAIDGINAPKKSEIGMLAFHCFSFVIANSFDDARLSVLAHMYPNKRTEFDLAYESNYYALEMPPRVRFVNRDIQPRLSSYLEVDSRRSNDPDDEKASGRMTSTIKTAAREQPEQNKTDQLRDLSLDDDVLPGWFKTAAQSEAHGGPYGCRLQYLSALIGSGCFYPTPYLQDPEDIAACFASLRARRVLYGIMFQKYREQLQKDNKKIDDFRVEEIAHRGRELCRELSIPPLWFIRDAADLKGTRLLPSLFEMESLDIAHRRKIFAIAMVDDSEWLDGLGPDAREFEFNLLLLRSWALRSPFLQKAHVTVLLLSILWMEKKYDKETRFFPWPIALRRSAIMWLEGEKVDKKAPTNHKHLLPFAQLQSVTETAFFLNFALKTPHGLRVASVREFYSEVSFYNLLAKWIGLNELGQKRQLAELLEADCLGRFSSFVDALYDKPETAPSPSCLKANGLSQDQIAAENSLARLLAVHHGEGNMSSFILESPARENDQDLILEKA